jgi:hypothetical protein
MMCGANQLRPREGSWVAAGRALGAAGSSTSLATPKHRF